MKFDHIGLGDLVYYVGVSSSGGGTVWDRRREDGDLCVVISLNRLGNDVRVWDTATDDWFVASAKSFSRSPA